jgi:hypothetical protein
MEITTVSEFYDDDIACEKINTVMMWKIRDTRRLTDDTQFPRIHLVEYYTETPLLSLIKSEIRKRNKYSNSTQNHRYASD